MIQVPVTFEATIAKQLVPVRAAALEGYLIAVEFEDACPGFLQIPSHPRWEPPED